MLPIKRTVSSLLISTCFITSVQSAGPSSVALFNGNDLSGWHEIGGGKWSVENDTIVVKPETAHMAGWLPTGCIRISSWI